VAVPLSSESPGRPAATLCAGGGGCVAVARA
jgi:hypothetical protein